MCQVTTHVEKMLRTSYSVVYFGGSPGVGVGPLLLEAWWDKGPPHLCYFCFCHLVIVSQ